MPASRPICIIMDHDSQRHDPGGEDHPENAARLRAIAAQLHDGPLASRLTELTPEPAATRWLTTCHSDLYLRRLEEAVQAGKPFFDHTDNRLRADSFELAKRAAGAGMAGIDRLETWGGEVVFCAVRPPGHHAEKNEALGFCLLNNGAIAARYWQQQYGRKKIAIIDWDAHHGNGLQAMFATDPNVLYVSIHEHPSFSFPSTGYASNTGHGPGAGTTLNIPLPPGSGDSLILEAITAQVLPAIDRFRPEALIVAAGFDGHCLDEFTGLAYTTELYRQLGRCMAAIGARHCHGRVLSILEGGYHLESLAASVEQYLMGLAEEPADKEGATCTSRHI